MKTSFSWLRSLARSWNAPLALLVACLLSYGLLIPWLSFYLDDWYIMWSYRVLGAGGFFSFFHEDRPFIAILFWLTTPVLGQNPIVWQIFGLFTRWLTVLAFYWTLRQVWPKTPQQVLWTALLFAVYPGFKQQWISVFYGNANLLLVTFMLSLGFMVRAVRRPHHYWLWTGLGLLFSLYTLISWEYYFGLDLVRLAILWVILAVPGLSLAKRALNVLRHWAPYLAVWTGYFIWRSFFFRSARYDIVLASNLRAAPLSTLLQLAQTAIQDIFTATWVDWEQVMHAPHALEFNTQTTFLYWGVVLVCAALVFIYLRWNASRNQENPAEIEDEMDNHTWAKQAIGIGLFSLPFAGIPYWAAGLNLEVNFAGDRFSLPMMLGVSLLFGGLLDLLVRTRRQKIILLTILLSLAVGANFQVANTFRREADTFRNFFWQLAWRAPGLKPQTTLLSSDLPLIYNSDTSLTSPLNWIYKPDQKTPSLAYLLVNAKTRPASMPDLLVPGSQIKKGIRDTSFQGSSSDELAVQFIPPGCLQVLTADGAAFPETPGYMVKPAQMSSLQTIQTTADPPQFPVTQFGKEPGHTWCYYFEKMDLAVQQQKWQDVVTLAAEAKVKGFTPGVASEWLPLLNAYGRLNQPAKALEVSRAAYKMDPLIAPSLCNAWEKIGQSSGASSDVQSTLQTVRTEMSCKLP